MQINLFTVSALCKRRAAEMVIKHHYLHRKPPITHAFGLWLEAELVGVCTFGVPPSRHLQKSACPTSPDRVVELNRLWVDDRAPRNTETHFVSKCLSLLPPYIVVSYADTAVGHVGYVYRAGNWNYAGLTDQDRKTPRFDYVPTNGRHSRDAFRSGEWKRVRRLPKHRYWVITGDRRQRKELLRLAGWPQLSWAAGVDTAGGEV